MVSLCTVHHNRLLPLAAAVHSGVVPVEGEGASVSVPTSRLEGGAGGGVGCKEHGVHAYTCLCVISSRLRSVLMSLRPDLLANTHAEE